MVDQQQPKEEQAQGSALEELVKIPEVRNVEQPDVMFAFNGQWLPSQDPALIGPDNYQKLINMRYSDTGLEGVTGYTKVNTTALDTYTKIKNGIHFIAQGRTVEDYTLVQALDSSGNGRVYQNQTDIGSQGDFEATHIWSDASQNLVGRFAHAPSGSIAYANGEESFIWDGEEGFIASVFTTTSAGEANPIDVTDKIINSRTDADNVMTIDQTRKWVTILTRRPAKGFHVYVSDPNTFANTITVNYWNGTAFAAVSNMVDGTLDAATSTKTLNRSGIISFDDTKGSAIAHHFEERYLYAYQIILGTQAGSEADISEITVDMAPQVPTNIWDGVYRTPIQCQVLTNTTTTYEDFTLHVSESSSVSIPVGCILDGFTTSDKLYVMFDEPMAGIRMTMLGNLVNSAARTIVAKYWNGSAFADLTETDGTACFTKSGLLSWNPNTLEEKTTLFGTQGYAYEITITGGNLSGTKGGTEEVVVDLMSGVPAQQVLPTYAFPLKYKSKLFMCGYRQGNEGNRIDYSEDNAPDIFNGENTSLDGYQSIYVGGTENLVCGTQLYNRFGSNLFASLILFKESEIFLLTGDSPLDYKLFPVSTKIGCPAPLSLDTAEIGTELGENVARNVALFVSNQGPMMYDGATLSRIDGIDIYFDPNESVSVNFDYLDIARGWFDSTYREYNILLPTGSSTTLNTWLVWDIVRKKWFQKDTGVADDVQCGFQTKDSNGDQHIYAGTITGYMMQLESGASWSGTAITNEVQTGDFFPSKNEWDITRIRRMKFSAKRVVETGATVEFYYYGNTDDDGGLSVRFQDVASTLSNAGLAGITFVDVTTSLANSGNEGVSWSSQPAQILDLAITSGINRLMRKTSALNQTGWCHSFKFLFTSSSTLKGMQPVMWGVQWEYVRKDHNDNE
jgi:hypothetical protein